MGQDCDRCLALLDDRVDGALDAQTVALVEAHAAGCASCAAELAGLRALRAATAALPRDQALRLWRHAAATGALTMSILLLLVVTRLAMGS